MILHDPRPLGSVETRKPLDVSSFLLRTRERMASRLRYPKKDSWVSVGESGDRCLSFDPARVLGGLVGLHGMARITVRLTRDPEVFSSVLKAVEAEGMRIEGLTCERGSRGDRELAIDIQWSDEANWVRILRRIEAIRGAAVLAATESAPLQGSPRIKE